MSNKPLGGKGKRESYKTSVVRVPDPIKPQVLELIEQFHLSRLENGAIPVTGLSNLAASVKPTSIPVTGSVWQMPVSEVIKMVGIAYPKEWEGSTFLISCQLSDKWWDKEWAQYHRFRIEEFNQFADAANRCIWQVDNSFAITDPEENISIAVNKLVEYGLLDMDEAKTAAATGKDLINWVFDDIFGIDTLEEVTWNAFQKNRIDILKALGIGQQPPIERSQYWYRKYTEQLAKPEINYWRWRSNPESCKICPHLTTLLTLAEPSLNACKVLECLAEGKDPFFKPEFKGRTESEIFAHVMNKLGKSGALADCKPEQKQAYRQAFAEWHLAALAQLGRDALERIYKVVYGVSWNLIEGIINTLEGDCWEILGIRPGASIKEAWAARKRLARQWHPDVNPSPLAEQNTIKINHAFEQFAKTCNR